MSARSNPKNWREIRDRLRALGARRERTKGSHETWRFPDGETFPVICNHMNDSVSPGVLAKFRRLCRRRQATVGDEPALLGRAGSWRFRPRLRITRRPIMSKGSGGKGGGGAGGGKGSGPRGGGGTKGGGGHVPNGPSQTGNPSGGGRGNAPPSTSK